jgi:hypothetical protein
MHLILLPKLVNQEMRSDIREVAGYSVFATNGALTLKSSIDQFFKYL